MNIRTTLIASGLIAASLATQTAIAATPETTNIFSCESGNFGDAACWSKGRAPLQRTGTYGLSTYDPDLIYVQGKNSYFSSSDSTYSNAIAIGVNSTFSQNGGSIRVVGAASGYDNGYYFRGQPSGYISGTYNLNAGDAAFGNYLEIYHTGSFNVNGGQLWVSQGIVGRSGEERQGKFTQTGGYAEFYRLSVGYPRDSYSSAGYSQDRSQGSTGVVEVSGGSLSVTQTLEVFGPTWGGTSLLKQTGGSISSTVASINGDWIQTAGNFYSQHLTIGSKGSADISGGRVGADNIHINGSYGNGINQNGGAVFANSLTIGENSKYIIENGDLELHKSHYTSGSVSNNGLFISKSNGNVRIDGDVFNSGVWSVTGGAFTLGGNVVNKGTWNVKSSQSTFSGNVTLENTSVVQVDAGNQVTYNGTLTNQGDLIINGNAQFNGVVNGAGSMSGTGVAAFQTGSVFSPGNSPAIVTLNVATTYAAGSTIEMELGGATAGTLHDKLIFNNSVTLGGDLKVLWYNGYVALFGDKFDLFDWNGIVQGSFANVALPTLTNGLTWNTSELYTTGSVTAVPEPESYAMFLAGLGLVGAVARRRKLK